MVKAKAISKMGSTQISGSQFPPSPEKAARQRQLNGSTPTPSMANYSQIVNNNNRRDNGGATTPVVQQSPDAKSGGQKRGMPEIIRVVIKRSSKEGIGLSIVAAQVRIDLFKEKYQC
jgi:hypothetical protein